MDISNAYLLEKENKNNYTKGKFAPDETIQYLDVDGLHAWLDHSPSGTTISGEKGNRGNRENKQNNYKMINKKTACCMGCGFFMISFLLAKLQIYFISRDDDEYLDYDTSSSN